MNRHELRAVRERRFDLDFVNHLGHAGHAVIPFQNRRPEAHQVGDGFSVPRALHDLVSDDRDRLGIVELYAAGLSPAGEIGGDDNEQLFAFAWSEVHRNL